MGKGGQQNEVKKDGKGNRKITLKELGDHRAPDKAWVAYAGNVYDVSAFGKEHPGGSVIYTHAGDDCTDVFNSFHPKELLSTSHPTLKALQVGVLDETHLKQMDGKVIVDKESEEWEQVKDMFKFKFQSKDGNYDPNRQKEFEAAYRKLRAELFRDGMFKSNKVYYLWKVLSTFSILAASVLCFWQQGTYSLLWEAGAALLLGLFWQQSGWLAHDFLHHQVFENRVYGDLMGILIGNVWQGFSVQWWKSKHNTHHAVPNLTSSDGENADGDPDIDTMPMLAWSKSMADRAKDSKFGQFMVKWQAFFYFPLLFFARLAWAQQSWGFIFGGLGVQSVKLMHIDQNLTKYKKLEMLGLISHYIGFAWVMWVSNKSLLHGIAWFAMGQCICGLFLALVFGLGHNGMAVYPANERPDFFKLQVTTTRNVISNLFTDWFCGGLQCQVDHHLFPSIPRHNFHKVNARVKKFCLEFGLNYHETNMWDGTVEVLSHLSEVSNDFLEETLRIKSK